MNIDRPLFLRVVLQIIFVALLVGGAASIPASAQTFHSIGPAGGDVRALAVDASHPGTVYLGTTDGDVFGSTDAGENWLRLGRAGTDAAAVISALVVDAHDGATIFATEWTRGREDESGGVYVSGDAGRMWSAAGLEGHALRALAQSASDASVLVAGGLDGVFLSRDHGATWQRISPEGDEELRNIDSLAFDPADANVIYAGTFHLPWKTTDGGVHWAPIHEGMIDDSDVLSLAVDAETPGKIYASACSGIYRSETAGAQWQKIAGIPYTSRRTLVLRQDALALGDLYAGTTEGLWISRDGGDEWQRTTAADWVINAIAIVAEHEGARPGDAPHRRIIVGTEQQGILLSDDGGAHLRRSNAGFVHQRIVSVAASVTSKSSVAVLMADSDRPAQISDDGGQDWKLMGENAEEMRLSAILSTPAGWRATLASGGIARFDRGANTWRPQAAVTPAKSNDAATRGPFRSRVREVAVTDAAWYAATDDGLYASSDAGDAWTKIAIGTGDLPVRSVQASRDGKKIRAVAAGGMIFSDDAGGTWIWHDLPLGSGGTNRLIEANATLLAFSPSGAYASSDDGGTWAKLEHGLPGAQASDALIRADFWVIAMQAGGLYVSRDKGASWGRMGTAQADAAERDSAFPVLAAPAGGRGGFYAGSANDGAFWIDFGADPAN